MPPQPFLDPDSLPTEVVMDLERIRSLIPQRFEMEQLSAITLLDQEKRLVVGYKDVTQEDFWVRGHMPEYPLMPGVIMCEAAAQLSSVFCVHFGYLKGDFIGFGGMDGVRFRGPVRPGDRLWLVGTCPRASHRRMVFHIQGFVNGSMVFNGDFIGIPLLRHGESDSEQE